MIRCHSVSPDHVLPAVSSSSAEGSGVAQQGSEGADGDQGEAGPPAQGARLDEESGGPEQQEEAVQRRQPVRRRVPRER